jgi:FKBP-type peptidyl-prolyl cis-trans isomerase SlyD
MSKTIQDKKFVELTYTITDVKSGDVLVALEYPLGYVHGSNDILAPDILDELKGKSKGDIVEVIIDCNQLYGPRDEGLVFTDHIQNVPKNFHKIGTAILMESENGTAKNFIVTKIDEKTLTVDGNNPLCGREVKFTLKVLNVRKATNEELATGGAIAQLPDIGSANTIPI